MIKELSANGLRLHSIRSQSTAKKEITDIFATIGTSFEQETDLFCVAYLDYDVLIAQYREDLFDPKYLKRCRVFNGDAEWLIWRSNGTFKGRFRCDYGEDGKAVHVVDAEQSLFGIESDPVDDGNATIIFEKERGPHLMLPFSGITLKKNRPKQRIRLKTRNYVGYLADCEAQGNDIDTGQATYVDCRFLGFSDGQRDLPYDKEDV